jgi:hypothetical protein
MKWIPLISAENMAYRMMLKLWIRINRAKGLPAGRKVRGVAGPTWDCCYCIHAATGLLEKTQ